MTQNQLPAGRTKLPADPLAAAQTKYWNNTTRMLKAQMGGDFLQPPRELSEALFRQHFLPFFAGKLPATREVLQAWTSVAGTPFTPVNILGDDGKVMAVVPPLTDTKAVKLAGKEIRQRGTPADALLSQAQQRATLSPQMANSHLTQALSQRFINAHSDASPEHREAWEKLLNAFGESLKPAAAPKAAAEDSGSDYDY